jgi:hypothetical protein
MCLTILKEKLPGKGNYSTFDLDDDDVVLLGLHPAVEQNRVSIKLSKKVNMMQMWRFLGHKIDKSKTKEDREFHDQILDDAMRFVDDNWFISCTTTKGSSRKFSNTLRWYGWREVRRKFF